MGFLVASAMRPSDQIVRIRAPAIPCPERGKGNSYPERANGERVDILECNALAFRFHGPAFVEREHLCFIFHPFSSAPRMVKDVVCRQ